MKVSYDKDVDAAHIRFMSKKPQGAIEIDEGVILHLTDDDDCEFRIVVRILDLYASKLYSSAMSRVKHIKFLRDSCGSLEP